MHKYIGISALALAAALAVSPAGAQTLDLGGAAPAVSVDVPAITGGSDNSVDLDNSDNSVGVDLDSSSDSNEVNADLPTGDGATVDIFGGSTDLGGTDDQIDADLGGSGDNSVVVDLFGNGDDAVVDLDAMGDDEIVVDVVNQQAPVPAGRVIAPDLDSNLGVGDIGLDGVLGGDVIGDLFGAGGSVGNLPNINIGDLGGDTAGLPDLGFPGEGDDNSVTNNNNNMGNPGSGGFNPNVPGATNNSTGIANNRTGGTTVINGRPVARPAALNTAKTKCFTPNEDQIAHLVGSRKYTQNSVATWRTASAVTLVPVQLCPEAKVKVSQATYSSSNMAILRTGIAASPAINQKLSSGGLNATNVLAVDNADGQVKVYVY